MSEPTTSISPTKKIPATNNRKMPFIINMNKLVVCADKNKLKKTGSKLNSEYYEDIDAVIGELLVEGKIIARCNGRLEWGPRALGNRSILADARNLKMVRKIKKILNKELKISSKS